MSSSNRQVVAPADRSPSCRAAPWPPPRAASNSASESAEVSQPRRLKPAATQVVADVGCEQSERGRDAGSGERRRVGCRAPRRARRRASGQRRRSLPARSGAGHGRVRSTSLRRALAMLALAMRTIAAAAGSALGRAVLTDRGRHGAHGMSRSSGTPPASRVSPESVPSTTWASVTVARRHRFRTRQGRDRRRRWPGRRGASRSRRRRDRTPAGADAEHIDLGRLIGIPAASPENRNCGAPPITRPISAEVPPMSRVSTSGSSTSPASLEPPITPAAGPEEERPIGSSRARRPGSPHHWPASGASAPAPRPGQPPRRQPSGTC